MSMAKGIVRVSLMHEIDVYCCVIFVLTASFTDLKIEIARFENLIKLFLNNDLVIALMLIIGIIVKFRTR